VKGLCQVDVDQFSPQRRRPKPPAVLSSIVACDSLRSALPRRPNSPRGHRAPAVCQIAFGDGLEDDRAGLDRNAQVYPRLECSLTLPPSFHPVLFASKGAGKKNVKRKRHGEKILPFQIAFKWNDWISKVRTGPGDDLEQLLTVVKIARGSGRKRERYFFTLVSGLCPSRTR
jgi:hypothetical protein